LDVLRQGVRGRGRLALVAQRSAPRRTVKRAEQLQ